MIADDHVAIRAGVTTLCQGTEIEVVCQAESCRQATQYAATCAPDVVLLDISLPDGNGLDVLKQIKHEKSSASVLMLSASEDLKDLANAHRLGADGFLTKGLSRDEMLQSIRRAAAGKNVWTSRQIRQVTSRGAKAAILQGDRNPLSVRETQVLHKITRGLPNELISEEMGIDVETVKQHVKHLLKKLHVEDRTQAALWALRNSTLVNVDAGSAQPL